MRTDFFSLRPHNGSILCISHVILLYVWLSSRSLALFTRFIIAQSLDQTLEQKCTQPLTDQTKNAAIQMLFCVKLGSPKYLFSNVLSDMAWLCLYNGLFKCSICVSKGWGYAWSLILLSTTLLECYLLRFFVHSGSNVLVIQKMKSKLFNLLC